MDQLVKEELDLVKGKQVPWSYQEYGGIHVIQFELPNSQVRVNPRNDKAWFRVWDEEREDFYQELLEGEDFEELMDALQVIINWTAKHGEQTQSNLN